MIIYSEKVIEHFMCPQNAHSMPDANAEGSYGNRCAAPRFGTP